MPSILLGPIQITGMRPAAERGNSRCDMLVLRHAVLRHLIQETKRDSGVRSVIAVTPRSTRQRS
jgi:hypothetical protein